MRKTQAVRDQEAVEKTVKVPKELHKRLKSYAVSKEVELRAALIEALEEYLKKRGA